MNSTSLCIASLATQKPLVGCRVEGERLKCLGMCHSADKTSADRDELAQHHRRGGTVAHGWRIAVHIQPQPSFACRDLSDAAARPSRGAPRRAEQSGRSNSKTHQLRRSGPAPSPRLRLADHQAEGSALEEVLSPCGGGGTRPAPSWSGRSRTHPELCFVSCCRSTT